MSYYLPVFVALGIGVGMALPAEARESTFERFRFDPVQGILEIRGDGDLPTWTLIRESQGLAYLEFPGTTHLGRTQALNPRHPSLSRILFAQNRPGVARLAVRGTRLPELTPRVTQAGKGWRLTLQLATPSSSSRPNKPKAPRNAHADDPRRQRHAWMGPARFDLRNGEITFPYYGANPDWVVQDAEGHVVFAEIPGKINAPALWLGRTTSYNPEHAFIQRVLVAQNRSGVVRLGVRGSVPIGMDVSRRRQGDHWVIVVRPYPLPTPTPEVVSQLEPGPRPTPIPLPELTPEPIATPVPLPLEKPLSPVVQQARFEAPPPRVSSSYGSLSEAIGAEALSLRADNLVSVGVDWVPTWADWSFPLHLGQQGYQFDNPDYPGTLHRRQVTSAAIAVDRRYRWSGLELSSGVGYQGRWAAVSSSAQAPVQPAPSTLWFSSSMALHGVELRQSLDGDLWPGFGGGIDLRWTPVMLMAAQGPEMPWLTRLSLEPRMNLGPSRGLVLGAFADAVFDPGSFGGAFHQLQTGIRMQLDFGPLGREPEVKP